MKRVTVWRSSIQGKGVFALRPLIAGERIFEYKGLVTSRKDAARYHARRANDGHTFLFGRSDGRVRFARTVRVRLSRLPTAALIWNRKRTFPSRTHSRR